VALGYAYPAEIVSVYDGDTVHANIIVGLGIALTGQNLEGERCRLAGINAPELHATGGAEAKAALEALIPAGVVVTVETPRDKRDNYGRPLVTIIRADGVNVNDAMVAAGHAVPYP
jgi:endonuclease YncB( thermonuclease family)